MKSILIPVEESELLHRCWNPPCWWRGVSAATWRACMSGRTSPACIAATGMGAPYVVEDFRKEDWDSIQRSRTEFERFLNRHDVPLDGGAGTGQPGRPSG